MRKIFILSLLFFIIGLSFSAPTPEKEQARSSSDISKRDKEVIKVIEILMHMELIENMDILNDMDIVIEEENHENNN